MSVATEPLTFILVVTSAAVSSPDFLNDDASDDDVEVVATILTKDDALDVAIMAEIDSTKCEQGNNRRNVVVFSLTIIINLVKRHSL